MSNDFPQPPYTVEAVMGESLHDICLGYEVKGGGSPIIVASVYGEGKAERPGDMTDQQAERFAKFLVLAANCHNHLVAKCEAALAYIQNGDFRNGVEEYGRDEGAVRAGQFADELADLIARAKGGAA